MEEKNTLEENESVFSDGYSERMAEVEAFKQSLKKHERIKKYILAAIPILAVMVLWIGIGISSLITSAAKSPKKFAVSPGALTYVEDRYIYFPLTIKNNSKYDAIEISILISLYEQDTLLGTLDTHTTNISESGTEDTYRVTFNGANFDRETYKYMCGKDLSSFEIKTEITEIMFRGESSTGGFFKIFLAAISVGICVGWITHVYLNTYCKKCKTPLAVKTVGSREVGRRNASWDETRSVKDKKGNEVYSYKERVCGEEIEYEYKRKCSCCADVTYRRAINRVAK